MRRPCPDLKVTNTDVSQQKLQLGNRKKPKAKRGPKPPARTTPAAKGGEPTTEQPASAIQQFARLANVLGTAKIRELCDLVDCLKK